MLHPGSVHFEMVLKRVKKKSAWKTFYDKLFFMWNIISHGQIQRFLTMGVQMYYNSTIS